jgi:hypothetical protein
MIGQKFAQSILTPIKPSSVLAMVESGWQVDTIFPMMVQSINGIHNRFYIGKRRDKLDTRFVEIVNLLAAEQHAEALSIRVIKPEEDIALGRTAAGAPADEGIKFPITIHSSKSEPTETHVKIYYRNLWFWIDDRDIQSKRLFTILQLVSMLAESPDSAQAPLLTIPAG